ncbi:hypothetical protein Taro_047954 [Colocasia esculenta]|uniref:Uncharacterized protein n=1 Tax=Colocasia esculenta TaxID=4460 RepID=A0A843WX98_COLES|nr:hypothetical protein [Colocasia esculenta]
MLLPLLGTPIPARLCQRGLLGAVSVLGLQTRSGGENGGDNGFCHLWSSLSWVWDAEVVVVLVRCRLANPSNSLTLLWFRSHSSFASTLLEFLLLWLNCVMLVSGCCGIALWVEVHRLAGFLYLWDCFYARLSLPLCFLLGLRPLLSGWLPLRCPRGLRYAAVVLAVVFWWVFPERCLGSSVI